MSKAAVALELDACREDVCSNRAATDDAITAGLVKAAAFVKASHQQDVQLEYA
jgi:hypothetical protein